MSPVKKPLHHHLRDYFFPHRDNNYRPHLFSQTSVIALAVVIIVCEVGFLAQTKIVFLSTDFLASVLPGVLTDLTNVARADNGLTTLTRNPLLDEAAQAAANDMAAKGYFAHVAPDGTTPWHWLDTVGYTYSYAGQNLAVNFTDSENVETAWLASPTHRENIMKPQYTEIGFGTANGMYEGQETTFVVEYFGTPAAVTVKALAPAEPIAVVAKPAPAASATPSVLGTEVKHPSATTTASVAKVTPAPVEAAPSEPVRAQELAPQTKQFVSLLASPFNTLELILTILLVIIASVFSIAVFMRGKEHRSVILGGAFLFFLISMTLLGSAIFAGPVILPADSQLASVGSAY
jgi:hypothetical protein